MIDFSYLLALVKNISQTNCDILSINSILGGAQKQTYLIECTENIKYVLYIWDDSKNYFSKNRSEDTIFESTGADLFELNNRYLTENDVRTPKLYHLDRSKMIYPYDFAIVQYISPINISNYFNANTDVQHKVFDDLNDNIKKLHSITSNKYGNLKVKKTTEVICEKILLNETFPK